MINWRLKFITENQLITIMAKEPMTIFQETSICNINANAFPEASFHSFKLVSMIHNALKFKLGWFVEVLMATKKMLKFKYKLGQGLGATGRESPILVELSDNKGGFSLWYEPTHEELFQAFRGKKRKFASPGMSIPQIRTTFPAPAEVIMPEPFKEVKDEKFDLDCIIWLCLEDFSMNSIMSSKMVQLRLLGKMAGLWTIEPWFMIALAE